jgi:preprotein translocase subunit SecF
VNIFQKAYQGEIHIDFVGKRRLWFTISAAIVGVSMLALLIRGLNLGIEFEGGTVVESANANEVSVADVRDALSGLGLDGAKVQTTSDLAGNRGVRVQTEELGPGEEDDLVALMAEVTGVPENDVSLRTIGPTFGSRVAASALRALIFFLIAVSVYISFRLEWKMAAVALGTLLHDLLFTSGVYSLIGFEVTPATVIAILTILGYSLYDTVVVFDKVLENVSERGERHTYAALVNMSMNQVLMRSINTSLTSLLPIGSLLFVGSFLLGATTLREFALALFIGVAVGTYSSIFFAAPLLTVWKEREEHWRRMHRRVMRKGGQDEYAARGVISPETEAEELPSVVTGAVPRPPKKRRRRR